MMYVFYFVRNQVSQGFPELVFKFRNFLVPKVSYVVSILIKRLKILKWIMFKCEIFNYLS